MNLRLKCTSRAISLPLSFARRCFFLFFHPYVSFSFWKGIQRACNETLIFDDYLYAIACTRSERSLSLHIYVMGVCASERDACESAFPFTLGAGDARWEPSLKIQFIKMFIQSGGSHSMSEKAADASLSLSGRSFNSIKEHRRHSQSETYRICIRQQKNASSTSSR